MRRFILTLTHCVTSLFATAQTSSAIAQFQQRSLQIKPGMTQQQATDTMRAPGKATEKPDAADLKKINASRGLIFRHPEYATIYFRWL